jgi:3-hydroxyisobutyrate dehydrogenase-like beta-hydroxyacid dehydrogenase
MIRVALVGGLGMMLSPAAKHWRGCSAIEVVSVLDRGNSSMRCQVARRSWQDYGAECVPDYEALFRAGPIHAVIICAGKHGDDLGIITNILENWNFDNIEQPFILHMSTLSPKFVDAAYTVCQNQGLHYLHYPITGGVKGAQDGKLLIMASGEERLYQAFLPWLRCLGQPVYFGIHPSLATRVKLISHCMVFAGVLGMSSAISLREVALGEPMLGQVAGQFFDDLNQGAGGSRQWELTFRQAVVDNQWDKGFNLEHAALDALYVADWLADLQISRMVSSTYLLIAASFVYLLQLYPQQALATQAILRILHGQAAKDFDVFLSERIDLGDLQGSLQALVAALPKSMREKVMLSIKPSDFRVAVQD